MEKGYEKRFKQGDIVYWCHQKGHEYSVHYGMVDEQFSNAVVIDYLEFRERRRVNGIPINEFKSEERYKKLPKGWTYSTDLFEITWDDFTEEEKELKSSVANPVSIKEAYDKGLLVKSNTIFHGVIEAEITKQGYRIVKKYPMYKDHIDHVSVRPDKVYFTYEEAKKEVDDNIAEFNRQANLSDYDWSVEQIDKDLNLWKGMYAIPEKEVQRYRDWLLELDNVEDVETRVYRGNIQWKYWKNKRWNFIEL